MVCLTRGARRYSLFETFRASFDSLFCETLSNIKTYGGLRRVYLPHKQLSLCTQYSTGRDVDLETTPVCVDFLRRESKLEDVELKKIISSVETIGFNSAGQMYRKKSPEALDFGNVKNILEHFHRIEGLHTGRLLRNSPFILAAPPSFLNDFEENKRTFMEMFQLHEKDLGKILSSNAYVLSRSVGTTVQPCAEYLKNMGFSSEQVRSIVIRFPRILALSTLKMDGIRESLRGMGIHDEDFAKVVWKFPPVMGLSASKVETTKRWLINRGLTDEHDWKNSILKFPQMLSHNLEEKFNPIIEYMVNELQLPHEVVKVALSSAPDIFGRTLDRLKYNISALNSIGMTPIDLKRYLTSFPGGLRLDIMAEPYRSKLDFLEKSLGQKPSSVLPVHPRYLSYSMERIVSRAKYLQHRQRSTNGVTGWCSANDVIFAEKYARSSLKEWAEYRATWKDRERQG